MMPYKWVYEEINQVHVELSTHCNARCPMCPRHMRVWSNNNDNGTIPMTRPDLVLESITYENFVKWFPPEFMQNAHMFTFCGTHGDPMMCKDVLEITLYVCNAGCSVTFNTNGGMRDEKFWKELAEILQINTTPWAHRRVVFSIDGLHDTNHLYRVNVPYEKAMRNAKTYIDAGGQASWDYLIFRHNEHQIEEAHKISKEMGFQFFVPKKALGFSRDINGNLLNKIIRNADGSVSHIIEPPTSSDNVNVIAGRSVHSVTSEHDLIINVPKLLQITKAKLQTHEEQKEIYEDAAKDGYVLTEEESCTDVVCKSLSHPSGNKEIYVDAAGLVHPCCYVGTRYNANVTMMPDYQLKTEIRKFGVNNISLKHKSLKEIIDSGYLHDTFETKWGKTGLDGMIFCNETCGEKSPIDRIYSHKLDTRPPEFKMQHDRDLRVECLGVPPDSA